METIVVNVTGSRDGLKKVGFLACQLKGKEYLHRLSGVCQILAMEKQNPC